MFLPHEMQWSLDEYLAKELDTIDEADRRVEKAIDDFGEKFAKIEKRIEELDAER